MNRARIARENAGLSIGQALRRLAQDDDVARHIDRDELIRIEELDSSYYDSGLAARLAHLYGVSVEWLHGEGPERDYATVDAMKGAENLSPDDRDTLAEFAASLPKGTT